MTCLDQAVRNVYAAPEMNPRTEAKLWVEYQAESHAGAELDDPDELMAEYLKWQEDETFPTRITGRKRRMTKEEIRLEREAKWESKLAQEKAEAKRLKKEARMDPKELLAQKEARLAELQDTRLVNHLTQVPFLDGMFMSGSTGTSTEVRTLNREVDALKGVTRAKPGPKEPGAVSEGKNRDKVVRNAMTKAAHCIKIMRDRAVEQGIYMRMHTLTFPQSVSLELRVELVKRIRDKMCKAKDKDGQTKEEFVMVWGIGDAKVYDSDAEEYTIRDRLHMHVHCFTNQGSKTLFSDAVESVSTDRRLKGADLFLNHQRITPNEAKAKNYHWAVYAGKNLHSFLESDLTHFVDNEIYSKAAIEEYEAMRRSIGFDLYYSGRDLNRELLERTVVRELPVENTGIDAAGQAFLTFSQSNNVPIEQMDMSTNKDGSTYWANFDNGTVKSARRVMAEKYTQGNQLPLGFYRAWSLHKEAGYKPTRSFMDWVRHNPAVHHELESKRVNRRFHTSPTQTE